MGKTIELTASDGHKFAAYVAGPENATKGIVVVQEIFGVNNHMRNVTDFYAKNGYHAIAPAQFDRVGKGIELDPATTGAIRERGGELAANRSDEICFSATHRTACGPVTWSPSIAAPRRAAS